MKRLWNRATRLGVMTLGFAGLIISVNAVPGTATGGSGGFQSTIVAQGTYADHGSLYVKKGLDVVVTLIVSPVGASSGWHSHPGGAYGVVGCVVPGCQSEITIYRSVKNDHEDKEDKKGHRGSHCVISKYKNGQTFIERPGEVVVAISTGLNDAQVYGIFPGVPVGGSPRIEQANPGTCGNVS
jgi:hypothetical protein